MDYSKEEIKEVFIGGLTLISALAIRKLVEKSWVVITKEDPPKNPEDEGVSWKRSIVWTIGMGTVIGLTKLLVRRNAKVGAEKWLKI